MKRVVNRNHIATLVLMTAMFLNPLGFDVLFYGTLKLTGDSYILTTCIFYLLSLLSLGGYFVSRNKWYLVLAMFFNPLGYDIVFYMVLSLLGSYMLTTLTFYGLTISLLIFYLLLMRINPFIWINNKFTVFIDKLTK